MKKIFFSVCAFACLNILNAQNFKELSKLIAADRNAGNQFGNSVSISGNFAVVGAGNIAQAQIANAGNCVYVFERKAEGTWKQVQKLTPKDPEPDDAFGFSVSIKGNYIIAGAPKHDHIIGQYSEQKITDAGAAYIFKRNESGIWTEEKQLSVHATPAAGDLFGYSVSTDGISFLVGAPGRDFVYWNPKKDCGEAYLFKYYDNEPSNFGPINGWGQYIDYTPQNPTEGQAFGTSVSVDGRYAVVGSPNCSKDAANSSDLPGAGVASIFITTNTLSSGSLHQGPVSTLVAPDRAAGDQFGQAVAIQGNLIIVGAPYEDEDAAGANRINAAGSAYVFHSSTVNVFDFTSKLVANDRGFGDLFGSSVSINNKFAVVGAASEDENINGSNTLNSAGSAYIFINDPKYYKGSGQIKLSTGALSSLDWFPYKQLKIVASDRTVSDWFGYSVAINDSSILIGAPLHDKNTEGIVANDAGGVYVFQQYTCVTATSSISTAACKTYTSPSGKYTWTVPGVYKDTVNNDSGCDSIITINLTFKKVDTSVTVTAKTITANAQQASFMWIDCSTNAIMRNIPTLRSFTPTVSGTYAVHVTQNGCSNVSPCYTIKVAPPIVDHPPVKSDSITVPNLPKSPETTTPQNNAVLKEFLQISKLVPKDRNGYENFGYSVAISGEYAVIGANVDDEDINGNNKINDAGSAYIFKKDKDGKWKQVQKIVSSDREAGDNFGWSVAISYNHIVVGAPYHDRNLASVVIGPSSGAAYIFERNDDGVWIQRQKIIANPIESQILFGHSVAIDGNTIAIGCPWYAKDETGKPETNINSAGAVFVFDKTGGAWVQSQILTTKSRTINNLGDDLGYSVSICGDLLIAGAWQSDLDAKGLNKMETAGAAYIFERAGGKWNEVQKIVPADRAPYDEFGISVAISGDNAIIGARRKTETTDPNSRAYTGNAYIFSRRAAPNRVRPDGGVILTPDDGTWKQVLKINPEDRRSDDYLGWSVGISGDYAIVSALKQDTDSLDNRMADGGAIYVYYQDKNGRWSQAGKLATSDRSQLDNFGYAVAISGCDIIGGTIVDQEDANDANALTSAGSAYIFSAADCRNIAPCYRPKVTPDIKTPKEIKTSAGNDVAIKNIGPLNNGSTEPRDINIPKPRTDSVKAVNSLYDFRNIDVCIDRLSKGNLPPKPPVQIKEQVPPIKEDGELGEIQVIKQGLTAFNENMWNPGDVITVAFFPGSGDVKKRDSIRLYVKNWEAVANLTFDFISDVTKANIRIGFNNNNAYSWSKLGRDALFNPFNDTTMLFGLYAFDWQDFKTTVLHEFGHAIGFGHEHQSPYAGISWDKEVVYSFYTQAPISWSRIMIDQNIFAKYSTTITNSSVYDTKSIMHYSIPSRFTTNGYSIPKNSHLSAIDSAFAKEVYPFPPSPTDRTGLLRTRDDCDEIAFIVDYNAPGVADTEIDFILEPGIDHHGNWVTWWKKIGIPLKGGGEGGLEIINKSVANLKFNISQIDNSRGISFWKAKLLGIHTLLDYKWNVFPAIVGGCRVRLTWRRDTCL